jgi:beta-alanine degradation protein BauB
VTNQPFVLAQRMTADRLDGFARAWLSCDLEELSSYLTEDALYSPLSGELVRGRDAVVRRFAEVLADDRPHLLRYEPSTVSGSFGACRWRMAGRTGDGGRFTVEGVDLYEFSGSLIRVKDVYQKC